jgi:hypothetical protein
MLLGVVVVLSPMFAAQSESTAIAMNAGVIGAAIFCLAAFELIDLRRWEETLELLCGVWLIASPFVFGYVGDATLMVWHLALGAIIALLAILELWQDWSSSDRDLATHGH